MNRFRCQYQKGNVCISEVFEDEAPISSTAILITLAKLAVSVTSIQGRKKGGKVALQILRIHEYVMKNLHGKANCGNGESKSFYIDKRNKNKIGRSERIDLEFYGEYGREDFRDPLCRYVKLYRRQKHWDKVVSATTVK